MAEEKLVHEQVAELLAKWNPPPVDHTIERLVGTPVPEGDGRATATERPEEMDHAGNSADSKVDAERMFADDGDDDEEDGVESSYDDMTNDELKDLLRERDLKVSGNHDELVARLEEDDASEDDDEE